MAASPKSRSYRERIDTVRGPPCGFVSGIFDTARITGTMMSRAHRNHVAIRNLHRSATRLRVFYVVRLADDIPKRMQSPALPADHTWIHRHPAAVSFVTLADGFLDRLTGQAHAASRGANFVPVVARSRNPALRRVRSISAMLLASNHWPPAWIIASPRASCSSSRRPFLAFNSMP